MNNNLNKNKYDWSLLLIISILFVIGIVLITSATQFDKKRLMIQSLSFVMGIFVILMSAMFDYRIMKRYEKQLYIATIVLLLLVYVPGLGKAQFGARSWINLGFMDFQTSEAAKITFTLAYASFLDRRKNKLDTMSEILPALMYPVPILLLLLKQPDLGGVIVFISITLVCLFVAGLNLKFIFNSLVIFALSTPIIYKFILRDHQRVRIDAFLNPGDPSYEGNFQVIQSMTAIGSGGFFGKGLFNGTISQYGFLPVTESDFIFAVLGEEFGFVGMAFVIILFFLFLSRIYAISKHAKDFYGTLVSTGFMGMLFYQVMQNIGMTIGLMPVTGVTLPFVSYGGSSMLTTMITIALIINIYSKSHSSFAY
ncbi:rod shape-determining protein RodA [Proteocatella sphenisci]|uniref:rod shape-determining protein RodA n=1 Tax=Proteocatella sphenisci TaxID=181070 RepID=UPI00048E20EA|nr:rod shape-determining protein RodA [Proteocatella sphenisci]